MADSGPVHAERPGIVGLRAATGQSGTIDSRAVAALYQGLYRRNPKMDLERFRTYIERQADVIRSKTGCQDIQFRIAVQDGKVKLKARPIHHGSST